MSEWVRSVMGSLGYVGVALLMLLESVFPPIPSEVVMPLAGFAAGEGQLNFWGAVAAGTAGAVLGAVPLYYVGKWVGRDRLCRWVGRHGHWLALAPEDIGKAEQWFDRHGGKAVLLCRLVPGVRSLISIPAGVCHMPMGRFLAYTAIGSFAWAGVLAWVGRQLGKNYTRVEAYLGPATYVILGGIVVAFVVRAVKLKRRQRGRKRDHARPCEPG